MVKLKRFVILIAVFVIALLSVLSATLSKGNPKYLIEREYGPGDTVTGWINISLNNEPVDSVFQSSCGGVESEINLRDLAGKNSNLNFAHTCIPAGCGSDYEDTNPETLKTKALTADDYEIIGFKIPSGKIIDVTKFSINVTSNVPESENLSLAIDILDDGEIEWNAFRASDNAGIAVKGCYTDAVASEVEQAIISTTEYCEKITIAQAPRVNISANVIGTGSVTFLMSIESTDGTEYEDCQARASESGEVSCSPEFQIIEQDDYFVCIRAKTSTDAGKNYKINYEQTAPCGFSGTYEEVYTHDFDIFIKPRKYSPVGSFILNSSELEDSGNAYDIENSIADYLFERYNNNCTKGCIIPVRFISKAEQELTLQEASLVYETEDIVTEADDLYELAEVPAKMSTSKFQKLYMDEAGFQVPEDYDEHTFSLDFNNDDVFSVKINVTKSIPSIKKVKPDTTAVKYPTTFTVLVNSSVNISNYKWEFGNGDVRTTITKSIEYTYNASGIYKMKITATSNKGRSSSRQFNITVAPASEIVPVLLEEAEVNIDGIKSQLAGFSAFQKKAINSVLNASKYENRINNLSNSITSTTTEAQYESILAELLDMNVPLMLLTTTTSEALLFYPETSKIDIGVLKEVSGEDYEAGREEKYAEAVLSWDEGNIEAKMHYTEISSIYADYDEPLLRLFEMTIKKKGSSAGTPFLIIKKMNNLGFESDYSLQEKGDYYYLPLTEDEKTIRLFTTEEVDFVTLPVFISPKISELSLEEGWTPYDEKGDLKKWIVFALIVVGLIIFGVIIYILLQLWYKKRYEDYLFKNKNNLYNLVNYIEQAKKKGLNEKEIVAKLRKSGWTNEQLRYAMRKYAGRRTGMVEIPVDKLFDKNSQAK